MFHFWRSTSPFNASCPKMVRNTWRILQQMLQDFYSVSNHFRTLCIEGLNEHMWRLHDLVPSVQFTKRKRHSWRSNTFNKIAGYVSLPHGCFWCFSNCANSTKSRKAQHKFLKSFSKGVLFDLMNNHVLIHFSPIFPFNPPENIRKLLIKSKNYIKSK